MFRYSFSEAIPIFFNRLKVVFSLSDRYKIFTSILLWIEICENVVSGKIDITMTTTNKLVNEAADDSARVRRPVLNVVLLPCRTQLIELNSTLARQ